MIDNLFVNSDVSEFRSWMEWATRFVIVAHISPDGDAVGSSLALCGYLREKGKEALVILPNSLPDFLIWLPGAEQILTYDTSKDEADRALEMADVICCLDFNIPKRVGDMSEKLLSARGKKIMIDHHLSPGNFCDILLSQPTASSTAELIFQFLCALGDSKYVSGDVAVAIYTGMMTDTGGFTYNSNHPRIYQIISFLLKQGIDKDEIYRKVYNNFSESRFRLMGYLLSKKMQLIDGASTAIITLSDAEQREFKYQKGDTEGIVNIPLQIKGVKMSIFLREDINEGFVKMSLRSVGSVPCNIFAESFGGGGHANASGAELCMTLLEAETECCDRLREWCDSSDERIRQLFSEDTNII